MIIDPNHINRAAQALNALMHHGYRLSNRVFNIAIADCEDAHLVIMWQDEAPEYKILSFAGYRVEHKANVGEAILL